MSTNLLESFRQAYRNLELLPLLTQKELDSFGVNYGGDVIEELEQLVEDSPSGDSKIVFAGHRGCGKSTLLAEFSRRLEKRYFVVFFSISDLIEMSDVNHINILFAIAVRLMEEAEKRQVQIKKSTKESFYKWFATQTRVESDEVSTDTSVGFDLFKIITGKLKADATIRNEIKQEFVRKISDLIARINEIAAVVQVATSTKILVIIDDLDKLDLVVVREIYQDHIKALFQPQFRVIFTIPIAALREVSLRAVIETETNDQIVLMPIAKLFGKGESRETIPIPQFKPTATFADILGRRVPDNLIETYTTEQIILYSGGVLRELIRIANECCRICLRLIRRNPHDETVKINQDVLEEALNNLRNDFATPLGKAEYEILQITYQEFAPEDPKEQKFLDLLHGLYVLEYRNNDIWYDIHPVVVDLLRKKGLINGTSIHNT